MYIYVYILSWPSSGVTYKYGVLDWTLELFDAHRLQFLITIYTGALTYSNYSL
jgi:hypothetical protein